MAASPGGFERVTFLDGWIISRTRAACANKQSGGFVMVWPSTAGPANVFHACLRSLHAPYKGAL